MATLDQLEAALVGADKAGDMDGARRLAAAVVEARKDRSNLIPDATVAGTRPAQPEPTLGERAVGTGEAALALGTGAIGGTIGMLGGTLGGLAAQATAGELGTPEGGQRAEQVATEAAGALTYQPRTTLGQEITQAGAQVLQSLIPVAPLTAEMGALTAGMKAGAPVAAASVQEAARPIAATVGKAMAPVVQVARNLMPGGEVAPRGAAGSVGAAAVAPETLRQAKTENLPVPINLTLGAQTREAGQLAFEKEQMKGPLGAPLRARAEENNLQALQNFDAVIDMTGAQTPDIASSGNPVVKALSEGWEAAKNRTRVAYNKAESSPEALAAVDVGPVIDHLNSIPSGLKTTGLSDHAKQYAVRLGIASMDENGNLVPVGAAAKELTLDERAIQGALSSVKERALKDTRPQGMPEFRGTSLLEEIKNKGGINIDQIRDLSGESRVGAGRKGLPPTLFTKNGQDLGDLANALREEGWNIPHDAVDGGVQALRDLIQAELAGEKQYSIAATDRLAMHEYEQRMFEESGMSLTERERADAFNLATAHLEESHGNWNTISEDAKSAHLDRLFGADTNPAGSGTQGGAGSVQGAARPAGSEGGFQTNVKTAEAWRKEISQATGFEPVEIRDSTILKRLIDGQTEPVAGPLYQQARSLRTQQARKYENRAVVARLITDVRGMADPKVAADQVFNRSILNASPEEITFLKRVLNTSGEGGRQAWRELQGATMQHIRNEATKGMGMDSADRPLVSPAKLHQAVSALDKNGRLDLMLGKKAAQIVRDLNDAVRYVQTVPPGTLINNSGTAGMLLAAITEAGMNGVIFGLPAPVLSALRMVRDTVQSHGVKMKIQRALNAKK